MSKTSIFYFSYADFYQNCYTQPYQNLGKFLYAYSGGSFYVSKLDPQGNVGDIVTTPIGVAALNPTISKVMLG